MRKLLVPVILSALSLLGCKKDQGSGMVGPNAKGPIVIGEVGSMTGTEATFGTSSDRGIQLAISEINAAGGVAGRQLQVIALDDEGKPEEAATAATRLISSEHVTALLGEVASTRSLFMAPKAQLAKVPMISPSSTNPKVTQQGDYIFRACFIDTFQGYVMAKFAHDNLKLTKVAILHDVRSDYSVGLADVFTKNFTKMGGTIVASEAFSTGDVDFKAQLTNLKSAQPEAIFEPAYYSETGLIARQARELGITVPLLGGDGWDSPKLIEGAGGPGAALEGSYFTNHSSMSDPKPTIQKFVSAYKTAYGGQQPDSLAALGYDAVGVLVDAMKRTAAPANGDYASPEYRAKLRDAIAATKNYQGITGTITIGPDRNAVKPAVVLQVHGSEYKYITTVNP